METVFWIKLANRKICIYALNLFVREYCENYIIIPDKNELPDILIQVSQNDIEEERKKSKCLGLRIEKGTCNLSDGYLETLAVYRKIAEEMLKYDTILLHGSAIAMDDRGYVFTAKSGMGKSTHVCLWKQLFGNRVMIVNDDKPLIHIEKDNIIAFGTPWDGKHRRSNNMEVQLKAICIIERSAENHICKCSKKDIYFKLVRQVYYPEKSWVLVEKTLELLEILIENIDIYSLKCNMESDAARVAYEGMKGE